MNGRKSTPKSLGTAEAYFICHIGPNFQILIDLCLHWLSIVVHATVVKLVVAGGGGGGLL